LQPIITDIPEFITLLIIPYLLIGVAYYLDYKDFENWFVRKYVHSVGLVTAGLYAALLPSLNQLLLLVASLIVTVAILSLPPVRFLYHLTRMGTREGESQFLLFINGISTSVGAILLIIIFFDHKWVFLAAIYSVAIGDGLGEFIGRPFGRHKYKLVNEKSIEGTIAVFLGSFVSGILAVVIFYQFNLTIFLVILLASVIVTLIEAVSILFIDNIAMQFSYAGILWAFFLR